MIKQMSVFVTKMLKVNDKCTKNKKKGTTKKSLPTFFSVNIICDAKVFPQLSVRSIMIGLRISIRIHDIFKQWIKKSWVFYHMLNLPFFKETIFWKETMTLKAYFLRLKFTQIQAYFNFLQTIFTSQ